MSNRRWSKFWWQDWQGDVALRRCSLAARGLWMEMLCLIQEAGDRGRLTIDRQPIDRRSLFDLLSIDARIGGPAMDELERYRVFSRDDDGAVYSRRVRKEQELSKKGSEAAGKRWHSEPNGSPNGEATGKGNGEPNPPRRQKQKQNQSTLTTFGTPAVAVARPPDIRTELWIEGVAIVIALVGYPEKRARSLLGKLLKNAKDDAALVLKALRDAAELRPAEPVAWLSKACVPRRTDKPAEMAKDWNLRSRLLDFEDENPSYFQGLLQ